MPINTANIIVTFKDYIKEYIKINNLYKQGPHSKYSLDEILNVIEYVLVNGISWRSLNSPIHLKHFKWQSFYHHFNKFCKMNVFKNVFMNLFNKYISINKSMKLKYLSVDTSCIKNEYSKDSNFGYIKKKRTSKLSIIVDSNGVPLSAHLDKGSISDQELLFKNLEEVNVDLVYINPNNKSKRYMLADKIYDTINVRKKIVELNINPIIASNIKNTKDPEKLKMKHLSDHQKIIYKKRIIVENTFSWLFKNRRLSRRYDKNVSSYMGFLYMGFMKIILKRMN